MVRRYFRFITLTVVAGLAAGVGFYYAVPPLYKSEFIFSVPVLGKQDVNRFIASLNRQLQENYERLPFSPEVLKSFHRIELMESGEESNSYAVSVVVSDPSVLPEIQEGVVHYIASNDFVERQLKADREEILRIIQMLDKEENRVDNILNQALNGDFPTKKGETFDLADVSRLKVELDKERIDLESRLKHLESVTVIRGFPYYATPYNKNLWLILALSLLIAIVIAAVVIAIREIALAIRKVEENDKKQRIDMRMELQLADYEYAK